MNRFITGMLVIGLASVVGCDVKSGTAPGTDPNKPNSVKKVTIAVNDSQTITQDRTDEMKVVVTRSENKDPVTLMVNELPKGVTLETKDLTIPGDQNSLTLTLKAAPDAPPVQDHVFHIVGKTTDITTDQISVKLTVKAK